MEENDIKKEETQENVDLKQENSSVIDDKTLDNSSSISMQSGSIDIDQKLKILLDIPITITVEIGSKVMTIEDIIKLSPSNVIDLDRYISEPIDLKVNGVLVAKGELYQVEDQFAIRIKEILTKEERVNLISKNYLRG